MMTLRIAAITLPITFLTTWVMAQDGASTAALEAQLARAIRFQIAVAFDRRTGEPIPARHCRHAPEGCEARTRAFAGYIAGAAKRHRLDPWLLTAIAFRESSFNPFATGAQGERGLFQIHPRSPWAKKLRFLRDEKYRRSCEREPGACQREVVEHAAIAFVRALEVCDGKLADALGAYNTGRCGGNPAYADRVIRDRNRLRQLAIRAEAGV